ncbi:MAG: hypothetical protein ABIT36_11940 [Steroidobacteraceae bacterium]
MEAQREVTGAPPPLRWTARRTATIVAATSSPSRSKIAALKGLRQARDNEADARGALTAKEYAAFQASLEKIYRALF